MAANWNLSEDAYHNSGHLLPSAAVREYLVSSLFRARGHDDSIVPCEGILLRPVGRDLASYLERSLGRTEAVTPIDRHLQAITVKPANFARLSNFVWAFNHTLPIFAPIGALLCQMMSYLRSDGRNVQAGECTPESIAESLSQACWRAVANFGRYLEVGVYWGSLHNNFTADGRFLDLEVPVVFGCPFVGVVLDRDEVATFEDGLGRHVLVGAELLSFLRQFRGFLDWFEHRLGSLARTITRPLPLGRDFLLALRQELRSTFGRQHIVRSHRAAARMIFTNLERRFCLEGRERRALRNLIASVDFNGRIEAAARHSFRPITFTPARPEPAFLPVVRAPSFSASFDDSHGVRFRDWLQRIEQISDVDQCLSVISDAERDLMRSCSDRAQDPAWGRCARASG